MKVFGDQLNPTIPYKTFVLSNKDTAQWIVKEMLEKYGLKHANAHEYCLVEVGKIENCILMNISIRLSFHRRTKIFEKFFFVMKIVHWRFIWIIQHKNLKVRIIVWILFTFQLFSNGRINCFQSHQMSGRIHANSSTTSTWWSNPSSTSVNVNRNQCWYFSSFFFLFFISCSFLSLDETNLPHPQVFKLRTTRIYLGRNHRQDDKRESIYVNIILKKRITRQYRIRDLDWWRWDWTRTCYSRQSSWNSYCHSIRTNLVRWKINVETIYTSWSCSNLFWTTFNISILSNTKEIIDSYITSNINDKWNNESKFFKTNFNDEFRIWQKIKCSSWINRSFSRE